MVNLIFSLIILLFSIVLHEVSHGYMAYYAGDPTAKYAGRLSLNPLSHLDPVGSLLVPLLMLLVTRGAGPIIGWAKPVPVNPYNFRNRKLGEIKVSLAGPASNLAIAVIFGLIMRFLVLPETILELFGIIVFYNLLLALFNLIPVPPLDGSHILFAFLPVGYERFKIILSQYGFLILLLLIFSGIIRYIVFGAAYLTGLIAGY